MGGLQSPGVIRWIGNLCIFVYGNVNSVFLLFRHWCCKSCLWACPPSCSRWPPLSSQHLHGLGRPWGLLTRFPTLSAAHHSERALGAAHATYDKAGCPRFWLAMYPPPHQFSSGPQTLWNFNTRKCPKKGTVLPLSFVLTKYFKFIKIKP